MKKVLVWGATNTVGGVEAVLWNYISNIPTDKIQFDFINTYAHISIEDKVKARGSKVISLPNRKHNILQYKSKLKKFMRLYAKDYDAVWLNDCMFGNIDILKLAKKYHIKKRIIHAHNSLNMGGGISRLIRHKLNTWLLRFYVTDYWACSRLAAKWSYPKDVIKKNLVTVVPNAIDITKYSFNTSIREKCRTEFDVCKSTRVFGHIGRFHYQKNHEFLIELFYVLHERIPDSKLWLIGNGEDEEKIRYKVEKLGIQNAVEFMGVRKDVERLLQGMDVFLLPSLFEGLPVVLVEAQASGLPCFTADTVTKESNITGNVNFYSLNDGKDKWADRICNYMKYFERTDTAEIIKEQGYSIKTAAEKLSQKF